MVEVLQYLQQFGLELHVKNKRDLAALMKVDQGSCNTVYSCSTKLSSQIRTAAAAGVQLFYVDSVSEMEKIKKKFEKKHKIMNTRRNMLNGC